MKIFRTEMKYFIRKGIYVLILTIIALLLNSRMPSFTLWLVYVLAVWFLGGSLTSLLRTHLKMDSVEIRGWGNGEEIYSRWSEVAYARREEEKPGKYWLVLANKDRTYAMPLNLLDADAIWQIVQLRAPQAAFAEDAAKSLEDIQIQAWEQRVGMLKPPFILPIGRRFIWLLLLGVIGWGAMGVLAPIILQPVWALRAVICVSVAILLTLAFFLSLAHSLYVDVDQLTMRTIAGFFRIKWDEIEKVRADPGNTVVIFEGAGKRLVSAPYILGGYQKEAALEYITLRLRQKQVSVTREPRLLKLPVTSSKSAKVKIKIPRKSRG